MSRRILHASLYSDDIRSSGDASSRLHPGFCPATVVLRTEVLDLPVETLVAQQRCEEKVNAFSATLATRSRNGLFLLRSGLSVVETEVVEIAHYRLLGLGWGIWSRGPPERSQGVLGSAQRHSSYKACRSNRRIFSSRMGVALRIS